MNAPAGPDLRDIHLPPAPSWWPPAPGWWILAAIVLAAIAFSAWIFLRRWRERRWRLRVVAELDRIAALHAAKPDELLLASNVSQLLRRASRLIEPEAAALQGEAWLAFLDRQFDAPSAAKTGAARFRTETGRALIDAQYRPASKAPRVDAPALVQLARDWLKRALPQRRAHV